MLIGNRDNDSRRAKSDVASGSCPKDHQMPPFDTLSALTDTERNELETLLTEFDHAWAPTLLAEQVERLKTSVTSNTRAICIVELVKIDLHRRWSSGQGKSLEEYCQQFPQLGSADAISPDLILAEFNARRSIDPQLDLESYAGRFPDQMEQVAALARESSDSNLTTNISRPSPAVQPQGSIETSHSGRTRDTTPARRSETGDLPTEFGRYRIVRELGSGAMGKVYLARDSQLDREVAIKTPSFSGDKHDEMMARFFREARAAAKIQHRNICPIYDVGQIDGRYFISMAFIKGRSMAEVIRPDKPTPIKTCAVLVHRLAMALAEAHRHNVIHRDLKPANIMIDPKREPVVMDFGLARRTDTESQMTQSGMILGTPAYMSPEQLSGQPDDVGPEADIYALGVILYELLTGTLPFQGPIAQVVYQIVHQEPKRISTIRSDVDEELEAICAKMMAKSKTDRYSSMEEAANELKKYVKRAKPGRSDASSGSREASRALRPRKNDSASISTSGGLDDLFESSPSAAVPEHAETMPEIGPANATQVNVIASPTVIGQPTPKSFLSSPVGLASSIGGGVAALLLVVFAGIMLMSSSSSDSENSNEGRQLAAATNRSGTDRVEANDADPGQSESVSTSSTSSSPSATSPSPTGDATSQVDPSTSDGKPVIPFTGALDQTDWLVDDSDGDQYRFFFQSGGVLHYDAGRGRRVHGTWRRQGNQVVITTNDNYSSINGTVTESGMSGTGVSRDGHQWTWQARLEAVP